MSGKAGMSTGLGESKARCGNLTVSSTGAPRGMPGPSRLPEMPAETARAGHALIIEDNMIISHAIKEQLTKIGFRSFDTAWTERQALELAHQRFPDLIVVGDSLGDGSAVDAARTISRQGDVTVILATANSLKARQQLPEDASLHGPVRIDRLGVDMLRYID